MLTDEQVKEKVIERGLISLQTEEKEYARKGGKYGFELCKGLHTPQDFERLLQVRHIEEMRLADAAHAEEITYEDFWEHRWATLQIQYVFERLKVMWGYSAISASAVMQVLELIATEEH